MDLATSAKRVQDALKACGVPCTVVEMPATTRSAQDAATAIGCTVGQIAKSLIFKTGRSQEPILIIASGVNRVNEQKIEELLGEPLLKADADFVREKTGFAIGGVPPLGHIMPLKTFVDEDLLQYETIWAAAGTPFAVFRLTPAELQKITAGSTYVSVT